MLDSCVEKNNACSSGSSCGTKQAEQKPCKQQYLPAAATTAASTNRQKGGLSCAPRHSLCKQRRHNEKIALLLRCPLCPKRGPSGEDQERGGKGARACSSSSSSRINHNQQQRFVEAALLLAAALAFSSACLQQSLLLAELAYAAALACRGACLQGRLFSAALAYRSALLPQRLQQQHCNKRHTCSSSSSSSTQHVQ